MRTRNNKFPSWKNFITQSSASALALTGGDVKSYEMLALAGLEKNKRLRRLRLMGFHADRELKFNIIDKHPSEGMNCSYFSHFFSTLKCHTKSLLIA